MSQRSTAPPAALGLNGLQAIQKQGTVSSRKDDMTQPCKDMPKHHGQQLSCVTPACSMTSPCLLSDRNCSLDEINLLSLFTCHGRDLQMHMQSIT
jgi:hypothetical protein